MELGRLIRQHRQALGLSQAELGRAVGVSQATIDKIESGRTTMSRYLPRIAAQLGLSMKDLDPRLRERGAVKSREDADQLRDRLPPESAAPPAHVLDELRGLQDALRREAATPSRPRPDFSADEAELPVFVANVDAFPIDWVKRPPLAKVRGAYGLLIQDTAMEPEFWPGDIALVHPYLPPSPQSACVFKTETPPGHERLQLKHLVGFDDADWHVRQWNPPHGMKTEFTLPRHEWPICHRVVGKYSRK